MTQSAPPVAPAPESEETLVPEAIAPGAGDRFGGRFSFSGSLRARAARGTLVNTAFDVGLGLLGLLKGFILAGFLSRSDYGIWGVLVVSLGTLLWIKQVGIGDKYVQQDELDQEVAFQKAFTLELAFTGVFVLLIAAVVPLLVLIYDLPQLIAPGAVIALVLLISVFQSPLWIYYRKMEFARQRALAAVDPIVGFVASVALAAAGAGYWAFVGGLAAGVCAASAAAVWRSPYRLRLRYEPGTLRAYTSFSGPLMIAGAASFVMAWIAVKLHLGVAAVGVIALASNITMFTDRVDAMVTGALYPAICAVRDQTSLLYESLVKSNRLALMWAVPFGVAITLFSSDLVRFGIGERWRPAVIVLEVYGLAAAINHVGFNWTAYFRAAGETRPIAIANSVATGVFLIAGIPLTLLFGLPGFAAGIALQTVAGLVPRIFYLHRMFPRLDFLMHASRSFLPAVPAAGAVLLFRLAAPWRPSLSRALGELVLYVLITAVCTWYLESRLIREAVSSVRGERPAAAV